MFFLFGPYFPCELSKPSLNFNLRIFFGWKVFSVKNKFGIFFLRVVGFFGQKNFSEFFSGGRFFRSKKISEFFSGGRFFRSKK